MYIYIMYVCIQNYSHPEVDYGLFNHIANLELFFSNIPYSIYSRMTIIYSVYHTRNYCYTLFITL